MYVCVLFLSLSYAFTVESYLYVSDIASGKIFTYKRFFVLFCICRRISFSVIWTLVISNKEFNLVSDLQRKKSKRNVVASLLLTAVKVRKKRCPNWKLGERGRYRLIFIIIIS